MADYSLVPVEHQPDFENATLVPVDHDPFSADDVTQQAQSPQAQALAQQAQTQPAQSQPPTIGASGSSAPILGVSITDSTGALTAGASDFFRSIPRGIASGFNSAASALGRATQAEMGQDVDAPTPEQGMQILEKEVTGPMYRPEGRAGQFGASVGEFLGNPASYMAPGSVPLKVGAAVLGGLGSEAGGQLGEGTPWEVPLRFAGGALGVLGPLGVARAGTVLAEARPLRGSSDALASRSASIYNPPAKPPRPFDADYPSGASSDVAGKLTKDIDGRDLTARVVVGRRTLGGADEALTPAQLDATGTEILGRPPSPVPASALPRNTVGAYRDARGPNGPERRIDILGNLEPVAKDRVTFHEFGHALDQLAGTIQTKGLSKELRDVYNSLNNPTRNAARTDAVAFNGTGRTRPWSPKESGYKGDDVEREYVAEALRAYMTDPNYLKTVAPRTAAAIREAVNNNPRLNQAIQFNSVAVPVGVGVANGDSDDAP